MDNREQIFDSSTQTYKTIKIEACDICLRTVRKDMGELEHFHFMGPPLPNTTSGMYGTPSHITVCLWCYSKYCTIPYSQAWFNWKMARYQTPTEYTRHNPNSMNATFAFFKHSDKQKLQLLRVVLACTRTDTYKEPDPRTPDLT